MISAEQLLKVLEEKDLLPGDVLRKLRKQIAQSREPVSARAVAKRLIKMGHLTPALAKRFLEAPDETAEGASGQKKPRRKPEESDIGLVPLEEDKGEEVDEETEEWEKELEQEADKPAPTPKQPAKPPVQKKPPADSLVEDELAPVEADEAPSAAPLQSTLVGPALEADAAAVGARLAPMARRKNIQNLFGLLGRKKRRGRKENVWDSPLLLVGGGALLLVVLLGAALVWSLMRQGGDTMLEQGDKFYREGAYTKAIDQYNQFLEKFPSHSGASLARVRRGLAQLRQAVEGTSNWPKALGVAKTVLGQISSETEFKEAHTELASLLPAIAVGLAAQAQKTPDPALVEQTRETLALVDKYVSPSLRRKSVLDDVQNSLAITEHEIARDDELVKAVAAMRDAINSGKTQEAYGLRGALLKMYPDLVDNKDLVSAVLAVSQAEQKAVKMVTRQQAAVTDDPPDEMTAVVTVAQRTAAKAAPGAKNYVVFAEAGGAVYGLDAATGAVLWRRAVGFGANGRSLTFPPTAIANRPGSDLLLVGNSARDLLRVEAATGKLRWRQKLGERFDAHPVVLDDRILLATRSGRLFSIDLESGNSPSYIQLSQQLRVSPAVDTRRSRIYQVAEHSNMYVLSLVDGSCPQVVYLGHEPGSITTAPVIVDRFLVVADNGGASNARLRVFSLDAKEDLPPVRPLHEMELEGHVDTLPVVSGPRMLVITDVGKVFTFQISGTNADKPLERIAQLQTSDQQDLIRFPLLSGDQFWIADDRLTRFEIQSSLGRLKATWNICADSAFLQPLVSIGRNVFHVRRRINLPGVVVGAVPMGEPAPLWETHLAAPLALEPIVDKQTGRITVVTAMGGVIEIPVAQLEGHRAVDQPIVALKSEEVKQPLADVIHMKDGLLALSTGPGAERIAVFDPGHAPKRFRWVVLPDRAGCRPIALAGSLLVPCQAGQVFLLDPRTGGKLLIGGETVEPFQPKLETGIKPVWRRPATAGGKEVVLADGHNKLYLLRIEDQPKPHLAAPAEADLAKPIVSPVAAVGKIAYAVDEGGTLLGFDLPKLTQDKSRRWSLGGAAVWGPQRAGNHVFLTTDAGQLLCLDGAGKLVWKVDLPFGPLAGPPLPLEGNYVFASTRGVVWRAETTSGKQLGNIETGLPLGAGPVRLGDGLLLTGHDGTLYLVKQP